MSGRNKTNITYSSDTPNKDICDFLMELSTYERNVTRNIYKSNAYRTAANTLAAHSTRVTSGKEAAQLKGIGNKIADKIDEFLATGKLKKLEQIRQDESTTALSELTRVSGVGPAKARQLFDQGIKDIATLRTQTHLLNHHQLIGLKYLEEFEQRIPRTEIGEIQKEIERSLIELPYDLQMTVCGSYRRGAESSGDIDVLLTFKSDNEEVFKLVIDEVIEEKTDFKVSEKTCASSETSSSLKKKRKFELETEVKGNLDSPRSVKVCHRRLLQNVVDKLQEDKIVSDVISLGDTKFMGVVLTKSSSCHRRLDIRLLAPEHYFCGVLYFTGSDLFNKEMRAAALEAGFTLNEYCIRPVGSTGVPGEPLPVTSEEDVFEYIGMKYRPPELRNFP